MLRSSYGSAYKYLRNHPAVMKRYLSQYWHRVDWPVITNFFWKYSIQAGVILRDFNTSNEDKIEKVLEIFLKGKSFIIYIVGGRGSGKTATSFFIAERVHEKMRTPIYYIGSGVNEKALPKWCKYLRDINDAPDGCIAILDESGIQFNAREFAKKSNINIGKLMMIARHKDMSLIFLTQHTSLADTNIQRLRDLVIWKMSNDYALGEKGSKRSKEHTFWKRVRSMMAPRSKAESLFEFPMLKRFIHFTHYLPKCWSDELSKTWQGKSFKQKEAVPSAKGTKKQLNKQRIVIGK